MMMVGDVSRLRADRVVGGKRELSIKALLEWTFGVELAQIEHPDDFVPVQVGIGMEWRLQREAQLGCRVDGGGRSSPHDDAELVAAIVSGLPAAQGGIWMARRVAEFARMASVPDWMQNVQQRCVPRDLTQNQHGPRAGTQVAEVISYEYRGRIIEKKVLFCPVVYTPTAAQITSARRFYLDWWGALLDVRSRLVAVDLVGHVVTDQMPSMTPWRK
jgi:hypothetical protein